MLKAVTSCFGKAERQVHVQLVNADTDWQVLTRFKLKNEKIAKPENENGDLKRKIFHLSTMHCFESTETIFLFETLFC